MVVDLAHDLPTKYEHFLQFAYYAMLIYTVSENGNGTPYEETLASWNGNQYIKEKLIKAFNGRRGNTQITSSHARNTTYTADDRLDLFNNLLESNIWFRYLYRLHKDKLMRGVNWIDFESEISSIIRIIDEVHESLEESYYSFLQRFNAKNLVAQMNGKIRIFTKTITMCINYKQGDQFSVREFRKRLYEDLEKLILAFEIYLTDFVEEIQIKSKIQAIEDIKPDYVITFNYTRTYENNYITSADSVEICHIHGVCDENHNADENNMVLGIDEYYDEEHIVDHTDFAIFRKFIQRIRKKTDTVYARWIDEIENTYKESGEVWSGAIDDTKKYYPDGISEVWCYGHSLDVTDRDVLKGFLNSDATAIHIFSYDKADEGELISKLLSIVDYKTVIEKSTSSPSRLDFIPMNSSAD